MRRDHEWKSTSPEGEKVLYRARKERGVWIVHSLDPDSDDVWTQHNPPAREELEGLRDVLWRKYQRRRVPWEEVLLVDKMIEALPVDPSSDADTPTPDA